MRDVEPRLVARGFAGADGHLVRRVGEVAQVIEVQLSIYGTRVTANVALDLGLLDPVIRWVAPSTVGPHAHDCTRWVRLGVLGPSGKDHWWPFDTDAALRAAVAEMGHELLGPGLAWLERESAPAAFLADARARLERSRAPRHPDGRFPEQRVLAAVLAWNGERREAERVVAQARQTWPEERARLEKALASFRDRYPPDVAPPGLVPDLLAELEGLVATPRKR